jgi:thiol-disulfide isomerase/thioredoxin
MKNIYFLLILVLLTVSGCKSTKPMAGSKPDAVSAETVVQNVQAPVNFSEQSTWLLGYFNRFRLSQYPYSTFYSSGYDEYKPASEVMNNLLDINKDSLKIKVVMGTWCPDSRREVPKFMKVIDTWAFPQTAVTFIGVDDAKLSPVGEYTNLDIVRVPTFIVYKNNIEAGRIIENPTTSLEQDLVNILTGMNNNK